MTDQTDEAVAAGGKLAIQPLPVRITHWINVFAMLIMIASGWRIYNAAPLFDFKFPRDLTLGGWLAGALQWHFDAMWLLARNAWSTDRRADMKNLPLQPDRSLVAPTYPESAIGKWGGVTFKTFLERVGADLTAKYVGFKCADNYYSSIDMATALHPQTQLAFRFADQILPAAYGFPMKLRIPTKLGFKNPKHITAIFVTNDYPGGYWEDQGYNWFSGS